MYVLDTCKQLLWRLCEFNILQHSSRILQIVEKNVRQPCKVVSPNATQHQIDFNSRGEVIDSTERIFELIKDGIPIPNFSDINPVSPDLRYKISTIKTDSTLQLNIIDELNGTNNIVTNLIGDIKKILQFINPFVAQVNAELQCPRHVK